MVIPILKKIQVFLQFKSSALGLTREPWPLPVNAHPLWNRLVEHCRKSLFSLGNLHLIHKQNKHSNLLTLRFQKTGQRALNLYYLSVFFVAFCPL